MSNATYKITRVSETSQFEVYANDCLIGVAKTQEEAETIIAEQEQSDNDFCKEYDL